ncbi:hypothetical protein [Butyrivibrio sp. INlla21]|uniref:hypothetical protein n=1 Tax=Butyrivibrio sp. INlla21 TaxID=1520811 RepID=UPI0008EFBB88|nr:hypothetical protein [Butyrivibrio sp. INlla21]SFU54140.1 hypothetical protein SAMN02910342_00851 [Butyrivibrio sp. INlla21]
MIKNKQALLRLIELIAFIIAFIILSTQLMNALVIKGHSSEARMYDVYEGYAQNSDVLFIGSSHAGQLVGRNLWRDYGIASYTIAGNSQPIDVTYHSIVEFLKHSDPKVIMVETALIPDDNMETPDTEYEGRIQSDAAFRYSVNYLKLASAQIKNFNLPLKTEGIQLLYKWPLMHDRYSSLTKDDFVIDTPYLVSDTLPLYSVPEEEAEIVTSEERAPISDIGRNYLDKTIKLCEEKNIHLVLFHTPYPAPETTLAQQNTISDIAAANNVPFIDFNYLVDEIGFDIHTDQARDLNHVNLSGGEKITDYLGKYLIENYGIKDHRQDPGYETWNKDLKAWQVLQLKESFEKTNNIAEWSDLFAGQLSNYMVILTLSGDYTSESDGSIQSILEKAPVPEDFYEKGGTVILYRGNILYYSGGCETYSYSHKFENAVVSIDRVTSGSEDSPFEDGIYIWNENYIINSDGLNVTIYDDSLDIVVDSIGVDACPDEGKLIRNEID